ncbi:hypothetical protein ACH5RR_021705 [Cinchona calisaya]|uniref:Uncharacterized protein n=1 Tax=Cinchona calisaya TaxID=153742 RepID=A0ABD2ZJU3_9GENT
MSHFSKFSHLPSFVRREAKMVNARMVAVGYHPIEILLKPWDSCAELRISATHWCELTLVEGDLNIFMACFRSPLALPVVMPAKGQAEVGTKSGKGPPFLVTTQEELVVAKPRR